MVRIPRSRLDKKTPHGFSHPPLHQAGEAYSRDLQYLFRIQASGLANALNGNGILFGPTPYMPEGTTFVVLRAYVMWGTASTGDNGSKYTKCTFYDDPDGGPATSGTEITALDTKSAPSALEVIQTGLGYILSANRTLWVYVQRVGTGVNHTNDAWAFGMDCGAYRVGAPIEQ